MVRKLFCLALVLILMATSLPLYAVADPAPQKQTIVIYPEADTFAFNSQKVRNYGSAVSLNVRKGYTEPYLRFDLSVLDQYEGMISKASFQLPKRSTSDVITGNVNAANAGAKIQLFYVESDSWLEGNKNNKTADPGELSWNTKPAESGSALATMTATAAVYDEILMADITPTIVKEYAGDKKLSLKMMNTTTSEMYFTSREGFAENSTQKPPQLVIELDNGYIKPAADATINEGALLTFPINKTMTDGRLLDVQAIKLPDGARYDQASGSFSWRPSYRQSGDYTALFSATGESLFGLIQVRIHVVDQPGFPELSFMSDVNSMEGQSVSFAVYADNPLTGSITYGVKENLPNGASLDSETGNFHWTPSFRQSGQYKLTFTASNNQHTAEQEVMFNIVDVNWPLMQLLSSMEVKEGEPLRFQLTAFDPEEQGSITYSAKDLPYGAQFDPRTGVFNWVPEPEQTGAYTIRFAVTNGVATSPDMPVDVYVTAGEGGGNLNLEETIALASHYSEHAQAGTKLGDYFEASIHMLKDAIEDASVVSNDSEVTDEQKDVALVALRSSVQKFLDSVIKQSTGDLLKDGVIDTRDLALVTLDYGQSSINQHTSLQGDIDYNSKVNLEDMYFVGKRISSSAGSTGLVKRTFTILTSFDTYVESGSTPYVTGGTPRGDVDLNYVEVMKIANPETGTEGKKEIFAKFDVSQANIPGEILGAQFNMTLRNDAIVDTSMKLATELVPQDMGSANSNSGITFNNKPASEPILGAIAPIKQGADGNYGYTVSVAEQVKKIHDGSGVLTLRVNAPEHGSGELGFYSSDYGSSDQMPRLVITAMVPAAVAEAYDKATATIANLQLGDLTRVTGDLNFPTTSENGSTLEWWSWDEEAITDQGYVTRPDSTWADKTVWVKLTVANGPIMIKKKYRMTVLKKEESSPEAIFDPQVKEVAVEDEVNSLITENWTDGTFEPVRYPDQFLGNVVIVNPGESIQAAMDQVSNAGGGVVHLKTGVHILNQGLNMKRNVTLAGDGRDRTLLKQGPNLTGQALLAGDGTTPSVFNFVVKDLTLEGTEGPRPESLASGILTFGAGAADNYHNRIALQNITVKHWAVMGVHMKRTNDIIMDNIHLLYNGEANGLYHNLYFLYVKRVLQSDADFSKPVTGKGAKYTSAANVIAQRVMIRGTSWNGIQADNSDATHMIFHKYTIRDGGGVGMWFPCEMFNDKYTYTENPLYSPQWIILSRVNVINFTYGALWRVVKNSHIYNSNFDNRKLDMGLLKSDVEIDDHSTFKKGIDRYDDIKDFPVPYI